LFVATTTASAQPRVNAVSDSNGAGFDTHLFRPALDSKGLIAVNGVDVMPANRLSLGLVLDYGKNLLHAPGGGVLVSDSLTGTVHVEYGIANRAAVGVSAPLIVMSGDATSAVPGWGPQPLDMQGFAHVALHGKVKLLSFLALSAQVGVPVSDAPLNAGADPSLWWWPQVIVEKRFGGLRLAANAGFRGHAASTTTLALRDGKLRDGSRITYGAGGSYRVADPLDVILETYATYLVAEGTDAALRPSNEALAGIKLFVEESSFLVIGGGPRYTAGFEAADLRGVIGFTFEPAMHDKGGRGLLDGEEDSDGDGIPDVEDACPFVKGERSPNPRKNGCPADRDDDGIPDIYDACPDIPGKPTRDPHTNGCPDQDDDGIPDAEDACPAHPGPRHPDPQRNGCPDVVLGPTGLTVFDKILFETGSAKILEESNPILDKVAKVINEHPELVLLEVAGHADERGAEMMNVMLTQARVESVVAALIARNVEKNRLRARGYGYYCPREEGHDEAAWSRNRRVEFVIVKTSDGPTGAPIGCPNATAHGIAPLK
jgi:outer membrane protein OmpA-like peptidoglycan-associated protein